MSEGESDDGCNSHRQAKRLQENKKTAKLAPGGKISGRGSNSHFTISLLENNSGVRLKCRDSLWDRQSVSLPPAAVDFGLGDVATCNDRENQPSFHAEVLHVYPDIVTRAKSPTSLSRTIDKWIPLRLHRRFIRDNPIVGTSCA